MSSAEYTPNGIDGGREVSEGLQTAHGGETATSFIVTNPVEIPITVATTSALQHVPEHYPGSEAVMNDAA